MPFASTPGFYRAFVGMNQLADQSQPETETGLRMSPLSFPLPETVEDERQQ